MKVEMQPFVDRILAGEDPEQVRDDAARHTAGLLGISVDEVDLQRGRELAELMKEMESDSEAMTVVDSNMSAIVQMVSLGFTLSSTVRQGLIAAYAEGLERGRREAVQS